MSRRFWLETTLAIVAGVLFVLTVMQRDWIETIFGIDPDNGSGALEWLLVGALLVVTIALFTLAGYEWRRVRAALS